MCCVSGGYTAAMRMSAMLLSLALVACASAPWANSDSSKDFGMDSGQCQAQAYSAGAGSAPRQLIYNACMQGKGWYKQR